MRHAFVYRAEFCVNEFNPRFYFDENQTALLPARYRLLKLVSEVMEKQIQICGGTETVASCLPVRSLTKAGCRAKSAKRVRKSGCCHYQIS
jgi:hypothetical protein